jgi:hypothetical protein
LLNDTFEKSRVVEPSADDPTMFPFVGLYVHVCAPNNVWTLTVAMMLVGQPLAVAGLIVTVAGLVVSSTTTFHGHEGLAFVVMLLTPVAPNTPLIEQPLKAWLEFVSVAWPVGAGLSPAVAASVEPVHVTFWLLLPLFTNVALTVWVPPSASPLATAGPPDPTDRIADADADALSGIASAAATAPATARNQYLRMETLTLLCGSGSSLRPAGRPRRIQY